MLVEIILHSLFLMSRVGDSLPVFQAVVCWHVQVSFSIILVWGVIYDSLPLSLFAVLIRLFLFRVVESVVHRILGMFSDWWCFLLTISASIKEFKLLLTLYEVYSMSGNYFKQWKLTDNWTEKGPYNLIYLNTLLYNRTYIFIRKNNLFY